MEAGLRTPLLDFFRKGDVAHDVRVLAARGALAARPLEQLGLLAHLTRDGDSGIRRMAEATLTRLPVEAVASFLARDVPADIREFFAARGIRPAETPSADPDRPLIDEDDTEYGSEEETDQQKATMANIVSSMSVPQRVNAALKGTREMRALLVRDPNRVVAMAVLSSPKVTESEVESFARMGSASEEVLRTIGSTRAWTKSYPIVVALTRNPKTPLAVSMALLQRLNDRDMRALSIDRNVPEPLRVAARKRVVASQLR